MNGNRADDFALMAFYVEAGVDTLLADAPIDRFTAEGPPQTAERATATMEALEESDVRPTKPRIAAGGIPRLRKRAAARSAACARRRHHGGARSGPQRVKP